ncbi:MAG: lipid-binding SYLF domain-containing protein [Acidobacteria bacterium]|nr:lipid-binding SYLF domain-containing protein [Acidobacteriota bacterium]
MSTWSNRLCALAVLIVWTAFGSIVRADDPGEITDRIQTATEVYQDLINAPDRGVPQKLLDDCHCVAVIPHVVKAAFLVGGRHGKGIVSCKDRDGSWSPPSFVTLTGGSFGFQIGAEATDLVLFVMNEHGARSLLKSEFTLGGDASVAAGPVGRTASGGTDVRLNAEIYAYARAKGLFAGISLEGASLNQDENAIRTFYGEDASPETLLFKHQAPRVPPAADSFQKSLPQ